MVAAMGLNRMSRFRKLGNREWYLSLTKGKHDYNQYTYVQGFDVSIPFKNFYILSPYHCYQILSWLHVTLRRGLAYQSLGFATLQRVSVSAAYPAPFVFPTDIVLHTPVKSTVVLVQIPHILRLSARSSAHLVCPSLGVSSHLANI